MFTIKKYFYLLIFLVLAGKINSQCEPEYGLDQGSALNLSYVHPANSCEFQIGCSARYPYEQLSTYCPVSQCGLSIMYLWKLFFKPVGATVFNQLGSAYCNTSQAFNFQNLTLPGTYRMVVEYKMSNAYCPCAIMIDDAYFTISNNVCSSISAAHSSNQNAVIKRSFSIIANCAIANDKSTILLSEQDVNLQPGFSSGTGPSTYFHAYIGPCASQAYRTAAQEISGVPGSKPGDNSNTMQEIGISIYPNPFNEKFNIVFPGITKQAVTLQVMNNLGSIIFANTKVDEPKMEFDLREYPAGVYLVKINYGGKNYHQKIIKN